MEKNPEILSYIGYLSYQTTGELIEALGDVSHELGLNKSTYRKLVTLMVEMIENNYNYVNRLDEETLKQSSQKPFFSFSRSGNYFRLKSGNPILRKDANALSRRIDYINQLAYQEIKDLYKNTMAEGIYETKKRSGAGLGIMKMAKISRKKISYTIEKINKNLYYYTIEIAVPINYKK